MSSLKKQHFIFIKISFYVAIFISIIYAMHYTKTSGFISHMNLLFGLDNPNNLEQSSHWCSENIQIIAWIEKDVYTSDLSKIKTLCEIVTFGYQESEVKNLVWKKLLMTKDHRGKEEYLEADPSLTYLKHRDLIFKNPQFKINLDKVFYQK